MEEQTNKSRRGGKGRLAFVCFALALALLAAATYLFTVRVGGRVYFCTDVADVRGADISCEEYHAALARARGRQIRWSVPIGAERFDSFSDTLTLSSLPEDEIGAYAIRQDGTKEYLLFHTYDICMDWLASDELCTGFERCFHKDGK